MRSIPTLACVFDDHVLVARDLILIVAARARAHRAVGRIAMVFVAAGVPDAIVDRFLHRLKGDPSFVMPAAMMRPVF